MVPLINQNFRDTASLLKCLLDNFDVGGNFLLLKEGSEQATSHEQPILSK